MNVQNSSPKYYNYFIHTYINRTHFCTSAFNVINFDSATQNAEWHVTSKFFCFTDPIWFVIHPKISGKMWRICGPTIVVFIGSNNWILTCWAQLFCSYNKKKLFTSIYIFYKWHPAMLLLKWAQLFLCSKVLEWINIKVWNLKCTYTHIFYTHIFSNQIQQGNTNCPKNWQFELTLWNETQEIISTIFVTTYKIKNPI